MNNNSILLINPNFDPSLSEKLNLVVKIGNDIFTYAIVDKAKKLLYAVYDEQECNSGKEKFLDAVKNDAYLSLTYKNVKIAIETRNIVHLPNELLDDDFIKNQPAFFNNIDIETVYIQATNKDFSTVFATSKDLEKITNETWSGHKKLTENAGLAYIANQLAENSLIIDFTVKSLNIVYTEDQKIAFQQNFEFENIDELTYYLLLTAKELNIDTKNVKVKVCGIVHKDDAKWNCLKQYFNKVDFLITQTAIDIAILDDMPAHYYTSLLALQECE